MWSIFHPDPFGYTAELPGDEQIPVLYITMRINPSGVYRYIDLQANT
jgi:hypothetical protein